MTNKDRILKHQNFNADDYLYLKAKGWTDKEVLTRWTEEALRGQPACTWQSDSAKMKLSSTLASN